MSRISPYSLTKQPPVILVADDDTTIRTMLRKAMEQEGYRVIEVTDGKQCIDAYEAVKPDIVLLEAVMPIMDGFTCCKQLVQIARNNLISALANIDTDSGLDSMIISKLWERTPILMITSLNDEESVDRAFEAGATDYITKPIAWAFLRLSLRRLLQQAQLYKQLEAANLALQELANVDGLTGLANRRRFDNYLNTQWINLAQTGSPLSLILCDIDFFKEYNDYYGHLVGGNCLTEIGTIIAKVVNTQVKSKSDYLTAVYGGDEFIVVLPDTDAKYALFVATQIQEEIRNSRTTHPKSEVSQYVTLSIGVATIVPSWEISPDDLLSVVDKALYKAKEQGRNKITWALLD